MDRRARKASSSFFKVYLPHSSSQKMKLPLNYTTTHFDLPDKAFLRDKYENLWPLELKNLGNEWFFQRGWVKFVEDYNLEAGEILVFHFDGTSLFDVKILERSGCEKQLGSLKSSVKEEKEEEEEEEKDEENETVDDSGAVRILNIEENHTDDEDEDEGDEDYIAEDEEEEKDVLMEEEGQEEEEEEERQIEVPKKRVSRSKSNKKTEFGRRGEANGRAECSHRRRGVCDSYGADIFESGLHPCPKNPYFVTTIRKRRQNELYIPVDVVKHYNLDLPERMTLRDPDGRTCTTIKRPWKDGRVWYFNGWKLLCKWNQVKEGDRCICEFKKENRQLFLKITFVPARARGEK